MSPLTCFCCCISASDNPAWLSSCCCTLSDGGLRVWSNHLRRLSAECLSSTVSFLILSSPPICSFTFTAFAVSSSLNEHMLLRSETRLDLSWSANPEVSRSDSWLHSTDTSERPLIRALSSSSRS